MDPDAVPEPGFAVIDIDGVLADVRHRLHHLETSPKNWKAFFKALTADPLLPEGAALVADFVAEGLTIVYVTGRPSTYRAETLRWLQQHDLPEGELVMRRAGDHRPNSQVKVDLVQRLQHEGKVVAIVDDDPAVVAAMRARAWPVRLATWFGLPEHGADPNEDEAAHQLLLTVQEEEGAT